MLNTVKEIEILYSEFKKNLQSDGHDASPDFFIEVIADHEEIYGKLDIEATRKFLEIHIIK